MLTPLVVAGVLTATGSVRIVFGLLLVCSVVVTVVWLSSRARRRARASKSSAADERGPAARMASQ